MSLHSMIPFLFVKLHPDARVPVRATENSAAFDLFSRLDQEVVLEPGAPLVIPTGIGVEFFTPHMALVCSRSGLAAKYGIYVLNAPGVIDPDYRGEIKVILAKITPGPFVISHGERIAQLLILPFDGHLMVGVGNFTTSTERGEGGLGSTGV